MITKTKTGFLLAACFLLSQCTNTTANTSKNAAAHNSDSSHTNSEVEHVVSLANTFKSSLTDEQRKILQLTWNKEDAAKWSNFPQAFSHPQRVGISFSQLNADQIKLAKALLSDVLDSNTLNEGFDETEGIQAADNLIGALPDKSGTFGSGNYYIAFLGEPSTTARWELQFGGHHLAFSNTYEGGKLVGMTPSFRGVEPMSSFDANGRHYQPMEQERAAFSAILSSLTESERNTAKLSSAFSDLMLGPGQDNVFPATKQGIKISLLPKDKQDLIIKAISLYVKDLTSAETSRIMDVYTKEIGDTYLAFSGTNALDQVSDYIRIDGPGVWIEYSAQPSRDLKLTPTHAHSIWRDHRRDYGGQ